MKILSALLVAALRAWAVEWEWLDGRHASSSSLLLRPTSGSNPALAIHSNATTLLELSPVGDKTAALKVFNEGVLTFELSSNGELVTQALRMLSGGIQIEAGGLRVDAGGIRVKGGLTIESGGLQMPSQKMSIKSTEMNAPMYEAHAMSPYFIGSMVQLQSNSDLDFKYLSAIHHEQEVMSIHGDGSVHANSVQAKTLSLKTLITPAADMIQIPLDVSYVEISDDTASKQNILLLPEADVPLGKLMVISNMDDQATQGSVSVPGNTTVLLIYNGDRWVSIDSLKAPTESLHGVRSFLAATDLDIGNFTLSAAGLGATQIPPGSVVVAGPRGVLEGAEGLSFSRGVLSVKEIAIQRLVGDIDAKSRRIK